jgi:hypothetical protein
LQNGNEMIGTRGSGCGGDDDSESHAAHNQAMVENVGFK